jgi:hypothetical protein
VPTFNHVFLSYRHESPEHARAVSRLGDLLQQAGIPVELDQFYLDKNPGGPNEGWPKWCEDRANQSACVVVIASPGWFAAYDGTGEPASGCGAAVEASLFRQFLYDEKGINARIRLAFLSPLPPGCAIPERLRPWHQFHPFSDNAQLDQLVAWIALQLGLTGVTSPTVRWPKPNDEFKPDFADRVDTEWQAVKHVFAGSARERILLFEGGTGLGKSVLVREAAAYAKSLGITMARVDLKSTRDIPAILGQLDVDLSKLLPNFTSEGGSKTHLLRKDLRALRQPALLIFDSYDQDVVDNPPVADWLSQQVLNEVETALGVAVIVAGQRSPDFRNAGWRNLARHLPLAPITEAAHWEPWIERRYPSFRSKRADLSTVLMIAGGNPAVVSASCEAIAKGWMP